MSDISYWKARAQYHNVHAGERLANVPDMMSVGLEHLLCELNATSYTQSSIADILNRLGIKAPNGTYVSNSNVSNTMRNALDRRRKEYHPKPGYAGKNHYWYE